MNRIKELREQKSIGQKVLAIDIGVSQPTICDWESGRKTPSSKSAAKLADYFGVSLDYLLGRDIPHANTSVISGASTPLTSRDRRDIARDMAAIEASLESGEGLMFNGEPLSPEAKESLLAAMRLGLEAAKLKNKERFTPKKYRKD